jgi:S1-C subfamily serine protease
LAAASVGIMLSIGTGSSAQTNDAALTGAVVLIERQREGGLPPEVGAGFFVTPDGHILTAAHVLLESTEGDDVVARRALNVRLFGSPLSRAARVLAINRLTDTALLKIRADEPTPYLPLGDSRSVASGDLLSLVGHPQGRQEWTVSAGIVDSVTALERIFLQATLFKGQSGGPAVNADGEVVAIAAYRDIGAQQSFLVPINDARMVLAGLLPANQGALVSSASAPPPAGFTVSGSGGQVATGEEVEPNDNVPDANAVAMGATVTGTVSNSEESGDVFDHFMFRPGGREPVKVRAIVRGKDASAVTSVIVSVYDENEVLLVEQTRVTVGDSLSVELPARAAYLIKVRGESGYANWWMSYEVSLRPA